MSPKGLQNAIITRDGALRRVCNPFINIKSLAERAAKGPGDFSSNHLDDVTMRFFGDTAITQGSETFERKAGEPRISWYERAGLERSP